MKDEDLKADFGMELAKETAKASSKHIIKERDKCKTWRHIATCACITLCMLSIVLLSLGITAVNRYFQYQESLIFEVEETEESTYKLETEGGGNAIFVDGDENDITGGDSNGKIDSKENKKKEN